MTVYQQLRILFLILVIAPSTLLLGGGLEKGFESLQNKDYFGAKKQFEKLQSKQPLGASFGLSKVHYAKQNPFYDIYGSLAYCNKADSLFEFVTMKEEGSLKELGITRDAVLEFKQRIADRAITDLVDNFSQDGLDLYLRKFKYAESYAKAVVMRDSIEYLKVKELGTLQAYRQFIIDYPGAAQRGEADSLYALKVFEEQTLGGDLEDYKVFVKEFPVNPYTSVAYDTIYAEVKRKHELYVYRDFIQEFPSNQHSMDAWKAITKLTLKDYEEASIIEMVSLFPNNPYASLLESELRTFQAPRVNVGHPEGQVLINMEGDIVAGPYEFIGEFNQGVALVVIEGKTGYIDRSGTLILPCVYDDGYDFTEGLAIVEQDGLFGAVDRFGDQIIPFEYLDLGLPSSDLIAYETDSGSGYLDLVGKEVRLGEFETVSNFESNRSVVSKAGLYGAIDKYGSISIPLEFDWVEAYDKGESRVRKDGKFGVYKHELGLKVPIEYDYIGLRADNGLRLVAKANKHGYVNDEGEIQLPLEYELQDQDIDKRQFVKSHASVLVNGKWGVIDEEGEFSIEPKYDDINYTGYNVIPFKSGNDWGYVDIDGSELPGRHEACEAYLQGTAAVQQDGKYGLVDVTNEIRVEPIYDELERIINTEFCIVKKDDKFGLIDRQGQIVIPLDYDNVETVNLRFIELRKGEEVQVFDLEERGVVWSLLGESAKD